jgi:hypothetical protein
MITSPYIVLPDGSMIYIERLTMLQILAATPTVLTLGFGDVLSTYSYTALDAGSAQRMRSQINRIVQGEINSGSIYDTVTPAITTVTVNPGIANQDNIIIITGLTLGTSTYLMLGGIGIQYPLASISDTQVITFQNVNVPSGLYDVNLYDSSGTVVATIVASATFT